MTFEKILFYEPFKLLFDKNNSKSSSKVDQYDFKKFKASTIRDWPKFRTFLNTFKNKSIRDNKDKIYENINRNKLKNYIESEISSHSGLQEKLSYLLNELLAWSILSNEELEIEKIQFGFLIMKKQMETFTFFII